MQSTGNTVLFSGGASGIGRAMAEALHTLGNQVIISGREQGKLAEVTTMNPGMRSLVVDMTDAKSIQAFAARAREEFPRLNVVINMAGIMRPEKVLEQGHDLGDAEAIVATNLLGPIRLTAALLPMLQKQPNATVMLVSSGLAFVPMAMTPTYCATKAAIHSYAQSLRYQLQETKVEVIELIPPYVATELMGEKQAKDPNAMPLDNFISAVMELLKTRPHATEIAVKQVLPFRFAAESGGEKYEAFFKKMNAQMEASIANN